MTRHTSRGLQQLAVGEVDDDILGSYDVFTMNIINNYCLLLCLAVIPHNYPFVITDKKLNGIPVISQCLFPQTYFPWLYHIALIKIEQVQFNITWKFHVALNVLEIINVTPNHLPVWSQLRCRIHNRPSGIVPGG